MKRKLINLLLKAGIESQLYGLLTFVRRKTGLHLEGWYKSYWTGQSVDRSGSPIPWFTYPIIHFLKDRVKKDMYVFEYGCGNSTIWWAKRSKKVFAVEHDEDWFKSVKSRLPKNADLLHRSLGTEYHSAATASKNKFHIIVVDGRDRVECSKYALKALRPDGVIIWDNGDRVKYSPGYEMLRKAGFRRIDFVGMTPINNINATTTVFYRDKNCLGI